MSGDTEPKNRRPWGTIIGVIGALLTAAGLIVSILAFQMDGEKQTTAATEQAWRLLQARGTGELGRTKAIASLAGQGIEFSNLNFACEHHGSAIDPERQRCAQSVVFTGLQTDAPVVFRNSDLTGVVMDCANDTSALKCPSIAHLQFYRSNLKFLGVSGFSGRRISVDHSPVEDAVFGIEFVRNIDVEASDLTDSTFEFGHPPGPTRTEWTKWLFENDRSVAIRINSSNVSGLAINPHLLGSKGRFEFRIEVIDSWYFAGQPPKVTVDTLDKTPLAEVIVEQLWECPLKTENGHQPRFPGHRPEGCIKISSTW